MSNTKKSHIEAKIALNNFNGNIAEIEIQVQGVSIDLRDKENGSILARNVMLAFEKSLTEINIKDIAKLN